MQRNNSDPLMVCALLCLMALFVLSAVSPAHAQTNEFVLYTGFYANFTPNQHNFDADLTVGYPTLIDQKNRTNGASPTALYYQGGFEQIFTYNSSILAYVGGKVTPPNVGTSVSVSDNSVFSTYQLDDAECDIKGGITATQTSRVYLSGGSVHNGLSYTYDSSAVNVQGGTLFSLYTHDTSTLNLSGGSVGNLQAWDSSKINMSGGTLLDSFHDSVTLNENSVMYRSGGTAAYTVVTNNNTVHLYGTGLRAVFSPNDPNLFGPSYTLSGTLLDGTDVTGEVVYGLGSTPNLVLHNTIHPSVACRVVPSGPNASLAFYAASAGFAPGANLTYTWYDSENQWLGCGQTLSPLFWLTQYSHPSDIYTVVVTDGSVTTTGTLNLGNNRLALAPVAVIHGSRTYTATHTGSPAADTAAVVLDGSASYDPENLSLSYEWYSAQPGTLTYGSSLSFLAKPGNYMFTLMVTNSLLFSNSQSVTITVNPAPNKAPVIINQSVSTPQGTPKAIDVTATDPDGDKLTYALGVGPAHGTLTGTLPHLNYTPTASYSGSDSFTVTATDPYGASGTATISIAVAASKLIVIPTSIVQIGTQTMVQAEVINTNSVSAGKVTLTSASLIGLNTLSAMPTQPVAVPAGQSSPFFLIFSGLRRGQTGTLLITGTSSLGTFTTSLKVTIP